MYPAELLEDRDLTLQLHGLLSDIDPSRWKDEQARSLRGSLEAVSQRMAQRTRLAPLREVLVDEVPRLPTQEKDLKRRWLAFKQRTQPAYARVAEALRAEEIHVPSLRPTNHKRSLFHVGAALAALAFIEVVGAWRWVLVAGAAAFALFAWSCEISRRFSPAINERLMRFWGPIAHAHESKRVNSATWYASALLILSLTGSTLACALAVTVLGVGDPIAGLIGRRFGRIKLLHGRSLEGTLAFVFSSALASFVVLRLLHSHDLPSALKAVGVATAAATFGAIAELVSLRVDDNLSIPLAAAAGAALAMVVG